MTKYNKLFTLEFLHHYYKDNICRDILVQPVVETGNWLRQNGCLFRGQLNVWHFFVPDTIDLKGISAKEEGIQLEFMCRSNNPNFVNFTDFPIDELGCNYFSNKRIEALDGGKIKLVPEFKPTGNAVPEIAQVSIGLSGLIEDDAVVSPVYKIEFRERRLPWRYYIVDNSAQNYDPLKLKGKEGGLFSGPSSVELHNGQKAQLFDSGENKLPLKEMKEVGLSLYSENDDGSDFMLVGNLPNAGPSSIQIENKKLHAAVYVYI